jgi:hypothetical protein
MATKNEQIEMTEWVFIILFVILILGVIYFLNRKEGGSCQQDRKREVVYRYVTPIAIPELCLLPGDTVTAHGEGTW